MKILLQYILNTPLYNLLVFVLLNIIYAGLNCTVMVLLRGGEERRDDGV